MTHRLPSRITGTQWQQLRKHAGLSVQELARLLACSPRTIYNIEASRDQRVGRGLLKLFALALYPGSRELVCPSWNGISAHCCLTLLPLTKIPRKIPKILLYFMSK